LHPSACLLLAIAFACGPVSAQTRKAIDPKNPDPAAVERQLKAGAKPAPKSDASSDLSKQRWADDYTNKVVATGVVKAYPNHDTNIPGDVIAKKMGTEAAAAEMWKSQNGKIVSYKSTCAAPGNCDKNAVITVVVDFGYIVDTHVYKRTD
jgi:hypothetical protein